MHQVKGEKMKNSLILPIILMGLLLSQNAVAVNQNKHVIKHTHINHDYFKNVKPQNPKNPYNLRLNELIEFYKKEKKHTV